MYIRGVPPKVRVRRCRLRTHAKKIKFLSHYTISLVAEQSMVPPKTVPKQIRPTFNFGIDKGGVGVIDYSGNTGSIEYGDDRGRRFNQCIF